MKYECNDMSYFHLRLSLKFIRMYWAFLLFCMFVIYVLKWYLILNFLQLLWLTLSHSLDYTIVSVFERERVFAQDDVKTLPLTSPSLTCGCSSRLT